MPEKKLTWDELGRYFGFPACCRRAFVRDQEEIKLRQQVSMGTGFVPCAEHARLVAKGAIDLRDLVHNRLCPLPFPQGGLGPLDMGEITRALDTADPPLRRRRAARARVGT